MKKPETLIVESILSWLRHHNGDAFHVHGGMYQRRDEPDLCGEIYSYELGQWIHFKIEVKTPKGKPTEGQLLQLRLYNLRGYLTGIVTSVAEFKTLLIHWVECPDHTQFYQYLEGKNVPDKWGLYSSPITPAPHSRTEPKS